MCLVYTSVWLSVLLEIDENSLTYQTLESHSTADISCTLKYIPMSYLSITYYKTHVSKLTCAEKPNCVRQSILSRVCIVHFGFKIQLSISVF